MINLEHVLDSHKEVGNVEHRLSNCRAPGTVTISIIASVQEGVISVPMVKVLAIHSNGFFVSGHLTIILAIVNEEAILNGGVIAAILSIEGGRVVWVATTEEEVLLNVSTCWFCDGLLGLSLWGGNCFVRLNLGHCLRCSILDGSLRRDRRLLSLGLVVRKRVSVIIFHEVSLHVMVVHLVTVESDVAAELAQGSVHLSIE